MKDVIAALLMVLALFGVWYWIAKKFKAKGSGFIVRHLGGGVCGFGALFIMGMILAATGVLVPESEKPKSADTVSASEQSKSSDQNLGVDDSDAVVVAEESEAPVEESIEEVQTEEISPDPVAQQRAEIEAGSDIGVRVEDFVSQFNSAMVRAELPYRAKGNVPDMDENSVQRVYQETFSKNLALLMTVKPETDVIRDVTFIGTGDGTVDSGVRVLMVAAGVYSATQPTLPMKDSITMLTDMSEEFNQKQESVSRILNGLEYSYDRNEVFGNMFTVSKSE